MFPYMIGSGEIGSYQNTYDHTLGIFSGKDPLRMAQYSGTLFDEESSCFKLTSLGQEFSIKHPAGTVLFRGTEIVPLWGWRLIILNHLARADDAPLANQLITFRETSSGSLFNPAFEKRSIFPLIHLLASQPLEGIKAACLCLGGTLLAGADLCVQFNFLPRFPLTVKGWLADEELAGSATMLFDASANHYLHTEDIAVASKLVVDFLIGQTELQQLPQND